MQRPVQTQYGPALTRSSFTALMETLLTASCKTSSASGLTSTEGMGRGERVSDYDRCVQDITAIRFSPPASSEICLDHWFHCQSALNRKVDLSNARMADAKSTSTHLIFPIAQRLSCLAHIDFVKPRRVVRWRGRSLRDDGSGASSSRGSLCDVLPDT